MSDDFTQMLAKMRSDFIAETPGRCAQIEEAVMALERGEAGAFDELFRQVHSLKGSGGTFGLDLITVICHDFETFITKVRDHFGTVETNYSLSYIDLLRGAVDTANEQGGSEADVRRQLEALSASCMPRRSRVLLIEPSATAQAILKMQFADFPIDLDVLAEGMFAIARLETEVYAAIVCSGEMPDLSAKDLLSLLRESSGPNCSTPVVLISSNPFPDHAKFGVSAVVRRDPKLAENLKTYLRKLLRI